jgi:hypothetical protein
MAVMFAPAAALAQSTSAPQTPPPQSDTIGPSELQNFSLKGSPTRESQQPAPPSAAEAPAHSPSPVETVQSKPPAQRHAAVAQQKQRVEAAARVAPAPLAHVASSAAASTPPLQTATPAPPAVFTKVPNFPVAAVPTAPAPALAPEHKLLILPWLLAALFLVAGTLFLLWRRRQQHALAAGMEFRAFVPPEPARAGRPSAPASTSPDPPVAVPEPAAKVPNRPRTGIVSSRLRPALEISAQPVRCLIEDDRVLIEFELELYNAGTAPARAVLAEASLFNAGANQEQELAAFFANPVGTGERLEAIPPMKRVAFANRVVAPRSAIQEYELGGRKALVPVLAFNALYQWSGGQAQTSAAFLVGRETRSDKLGPLSIDKMPREYRALAAHQLPTAVRT